MSITSHSRRSILQALALGAGAVPFAKLAPGDLLPLERAAYAADGAPKRILFFFDPHGLHESLGWKCYAKPGVGPEPAQFAGAGARATAASETTEFTLLGMNVPLEKYKSEMVVIDSLCRLPIENGDQHNGGFNSLLTASGLVKDWKGRGFPPAAGVSIDYYLGQKLGTMLTPKFPFLSLGVQTSQFGEGLTFMGGGQRIFPHDGGNADPFKVYAKLFTGLLDPSKPAGAQDPALVARLAVRGSVLDFVAKDVVAFGKRLGTDDRARADAHLDAIRTLEKRLSTNLTGGAPGARCAAPTQRPAFSIDDPRNHREILRAQLDNVAAAFACDLTRVATIYVKHRFQNGANFEPINNPNFDVHGLSHDRRDEFVAARTAHNEDLVAFLDKLRSIPEGNGTMLDNTIVFACTECSHGHTNKVMPFMTIGGKNMGVRTGRYLIVPSRTPHKRLLTSFVKAMGLPDDDFGDRMGGFEDPVGVFKPIDLGTGPLPGYLTGT